jgi:hypothetical protein
VTNIEQNPSRIRHMLFTGAPTKSGDSDAMSCGYIPLKEAPLPRCRRHFSSLYHTIKVNL